MKQEKQPLADIMREMTASADYRKVKAEMMKLHRKFSKVRYVMLFNPDEQTLEMLKNEGFECTRTSIKEYVQYKISW